MHRILILLLLLAAAVAFADSPEQQLARARVLKKNGVMIEAITTYQNYLKVKSDDQEARIELVEIYLILKRNENAFEQIQILKKALPNDPRVIKFVMMMEGTATRKRTNLLQDYEKQIKDPNVDPDVILDFARYLSGVNNTARSIEMYNRYLGARPGNDVARLELAKQYGWTRNYKQSHEELNRLLTKNPKNREARVFLGNITYWQGKEDEAIAIYTSVLKEDPNHREANAALKRITGSADYRERKLWESVAKDSSGADLVLLAQLLHGAERDWEADSLVSVRLKLVPADSAAIVLREDIKEAQKKRNEKMLGTYRERFEKNPLDTAAILNLTRFYQSLPDWKAALEIYNGYIEKRPMDYAIRLERAKALNWSGRSKEAAEEFRLVSTAQPNNREAQLGLASALLYANENLNEAESIYRSDLTLNPDDLQSKLGLAEAMRRQGLFDEARNMYLEVLKSDSLNEEGLEGIKSLDQDLSPLVRQLENKLKSDPGNSILMRRLAGLYLDANRFFEADELVTRLLASTPDDRKLQMMQTDIKKRKIAHDTEQLRKAKLQVQLYPDSTSFRVEYADRLAEAGKTREAVAQYKLVAERRPGEPDVRMKMAELLSADKQLKESIEIYRQLSDDFPMNFDYRFRYAQAISWDGDNDRAISEYERALRLNPESVDCQYGIANAYRWKGDVYAAAEAYERVLAMNPRHKDAREQLQSLSGPLFRGGKTISRNLTDNAGYHQTETEALAVFSFDLRSQLRIGGGTMQVKQDGFRQLGYYSAGEFEYNFDKLTKGIGEYRGYVFKHRKSSLSRVQFEHDFQDVPDLKGLYGYVYYSSQDGIFELASTKELQVWYKGLTAERIGCGGFYDYTDKWKYEFAASQLTISDKNMRTEGWIEGAYVYKPNINFGGRYEFADASKVDTTFGYWAPDQYATASVFAEMHANYPKLSYSFKVSVGRVVKTNDGIRMFNFDASYRLTKKISAAGSYSYLRTLRSDGEYNYHGALGAILIDIN